MVYIYALILGIVQAITEFLPISSSGHLVILHNILNFNLEQNVAFDLALHLGTACALVIYFREELKKYFWAVIKIFIPGKSIVQSDLKVALNIFYATIPAGCAGVIFESIIEKYVRSTEIIIITLLLGAILFFIAEKFFEKTRDFSGLSGWKSVYIGIAQALALIPGVSRSGITIVAGMSLKLKRSEAARFSFLMGIPIIFGAALFKIVKINFDYLSSQDIAFFLIGFSSSFVLGFFVVKHLLKYLQNHSLKIFAWYRICLAMFLAIGMFLAR
ncbi:undecaprenyl-diphosphatase UppP [Patescibacteria group bacterium]|nr:undecaprenyl-diphosphatase UppP [Patescibacteria group bacterium]